MDLGRNITALVIAGVVLFLLAEAAEASGAVNAVRDGMKRLFMKPASAPLTVPAERLPRGEDLGIRPITDQTTPLLMPPPTR